MSKEVKRYEVTVLLDASSSYTVEADSVEAAEHAAWEAHDEASPSLCHQCSGSMDLGDAYGMLIYCDGNEVADTTHDAREIADLRAELDALLAERDALKAFANEIVSGAFEGGSFDGGDIQDMGVKHGLLRIEQRDDECGEACACREYGFPSECYRKTELLGFAALQGAQP